MATIFRTVKLRVTEVTGTYQALLTDDLVLADAESAPFTVTLPSVAAAKGKLIRIKRINDNENDVTIVGIE